jgi:hypothetical protein
VLLVAGEVTGTVLVAGVLSLLVSIGAGVGGCFFLRSERFARRLGAATQRPLEWALAG